MIDEANNNSNSQKFEQLKAYIIKDLSSSSPVIVLDYIYPERKLLCQWKKLDDTFIISPEGASYNISDPNQQIFMMDFSYHISKCYHLLGLLHDEYHSGIAINEQKYLKRYDEEDDEYIEVNEKSLRQIKITF